MPSHPAIFTLSFNSSLDNTFYLPYLRFDDINRIEKSRIDAGGKGLNVARMLNVLGCRCKAITLLGGTNGKIIKKLLKEEGVPFSYVPIKGNTRSIFNFIAGEKILRINEPGPSISKKEKEAFLKLIYSLKIKGGDIVSISGSVPPGIEKDIYRKIITKLKNKGAVVALDTDNELLKEGIKAKPHIIKPNLWELSRLSGKKIKSVKELRKILNSLLIYGIPIILLTNGQKGAILFSRTHFLYGMPPSVKTVSTIGCGDTFLAGFLYGYIKGKSPEESLKLAISSGTAKALKEGTSMPEKEDVERIFKKVKIINVREVSELPFF